MGNSIFSKETYQTRNPVPTPVFRGFLGFILFVTCFLGISQWLGRSPLGLHLPPGFVTGSSPDFDFRIHYLEHFIRQNGGVDCLLIGSSQIANAIDPQVVEAAYFQKTGQTIRCFNFGLPSLTADTAGPLAEALVNKYQPRLVVFEVSPRSFSRRFGDITRYLSQDPWVLYQLGNYTFEGWARDNLLAYRYYLSLKTWLYPYNHKALRLAMESVDERGFAPATGHRPAGESELSGLEIRFEKPFWKGFLQVLDLQSKTNVVIYESPVKEDYLNIYVEGGQAAYDENFIAVINQELSQRGIPFWRAQLEISPNITADMWYDSRHVNHAGAIFVSEWMGETMATTAALFINK